jgi:hypothetical protein
MLENLLLDTGFSPSAKALMHVLPIAEALLFRDNQNHVVVLPHPGMLPRARRLPHAVVPVAS